jgi:DNA-binding GntR family transcriptional regulator
MAPVDRMRALETVLVPSAGEVVVAQLTRAIELGRLLPGDRLPAERELATQLGVARVTLRSALGDLEAAGLLGAPAAAPWSSPRSRWAPERVGTAPSATN